MSFFLKKKKKRIVKRYPQGNSEFPSVKFENFHINNSIKFIDNYLMKKVGKLSVTRIVATAAATTTITLGKS